ncbi:uncharacterized protein LOC110985267 [Acanthaster planci]|uniref:Uncharacterized protein LOC110985267 n=1 Tax=Acanthaster planci TaxID=133434 RepID=A0A8B7Z880_ACAPL|nr:uncharacterized protein LOC110985267 [Acanthaster planci]
MEKSVFTVLVICLFGLAEEIGGTVCTITQEPDPNSLNRYRWMIPVKNPCLCTEVWMGGVFTRSAVRPFKTTYLNTFLHSEDFEEVQNWMNCSCSFIAPASKPHRFTFILQPLTMPFRLNFKLKSAREPLVALSEGMTENFIFAEINIGGWGNTKSVIRPCQSETGGGRCKVVQVQHVETGIVSGDEYRFFWIEFKEGVVRVGKGGQEEAFLKWDAGSSLKRVLTQVHIGIASWHIANSEFVFFQYC